MTDPTVTDAAADDLHGGALAGDDVDSVADGGPLA
jgi:hypothetical protein